MKGDEMGYRAVRSKGFVMLSEKAVFLGRANSLILSSNTHGKTDFKYREQILKMNQFF